MDPPIKTLQVLGLTSSIFLSGGYFSSSHLTVPILYHLPTSTSTSFFAKFYHRGVMTVVPLAIVSAVSSAAVAYLVPSRSMEYMAAAAATLATLPWTVLVMTNTNRKLMELNANAVEREKVGDAHVVTLLKKWRWMNLVRSAMALVGGLLGTMALIQ